MTQVTFESEGTVFINEKAVREIELDESAVYRLSFLGSEPFYAPFSLGTDDPRFIIRHESDGHCVVHIDTSLKPSSFFAQERSDIAMLTIYRTANEFHIVTENSQSFLDELAPFSLQNVKTACDGDLFFVKGTLKNKQYLYVSSGERLCTLLCLQADDIRLSEKGIEVSEEIHSMSAVKRVTLYRYDGNEYQLDSSRFERREHEYVSALSCHLFLESVLLGDDETLARLLCEELRPSADRLKSYLGTFELLQSEPYTENTVTVYYKKGNHFYLGKIEFEIKNGLICDVNKKFDF